MSQEVASQAPRFTRQAAPVKENRRFCLRKRIRKWYDIWCKFRFNVVCIMRDMIEGSLELKLPTILTDEKQSWSRRIEKGRAEERRSEKRKSQKKEDAGARQGRKVAKHCFSNDLWLRRVEKVGSLKRRVRSQLARWEMKNCTPFWREAHFEVKMYKTHHSRTTFGRWDFEKVHAVVARSTFRSQNVKQTKDSDHFWTFRCHFAWQAQGIVHLVRSEQNARVL